MPNIYIIGDDGFRNNCQVFRTLTYDKIKEDTEASYRQVSRVLNVGRKIIEVATKR
jgi:hypothetical protein